MISVGPIAVEARLTLAIPLMAVSASAGFPSPADDYIEGPVDFNKLMVQNASATFAVRIVGDSMTGAGMFPGDIAVVDKAAEPHDRCIILAVVNGDFTIKRFRKKRGRIVLQAENPAYQDIVITEGMGFRVWGVISKSIRML